MPNWCNNSITLRHADSAMVQRAQEALANGRLLQEFIPCPQDLIDTVAGFMGEDKREAHEAHVLGTLMAGLRNDAVGGRGAGV